VTQNEQILLDALNGILKNAYLGRQSSISTADTYLTVPFLVSSEHLLNAQEAVKQVTTTTQGDTQKGGEE